MIAGVLETGSYILVIFLFLCLIRAIIGPSVADRVAAVSVISTKTVVLIVFVALANHQLFYFDVALVYALISFLMSLGMAKYLEKGHLS